MYNLLTRKSKVKKLIFETFIGNNIEFTVDQQVLMATILITGLATLLSIPMDILTNAPIVLMITNSVAILFFALFYLLTRVYKIYKNISSLYILVLFFTFSLDWFPNGGMQSGVAYFYFTFLGYIIFLTKGLRQIIFLIIYIIDLTVLFLLEINFPNLVTFRISQEDKLLDSYFCFLTMLFFIAFLVYVLKKLYHQERKNSIDIINQYRKSSENLKEKYHEVINLLSIREKEVFERIIEGKSNKEIACNLYIDEGTVKNHVTNIYKKLEVNKRVELIQKVNQYS